MTDLRTDSPRHIGASQPFILRTDPQPERNDENDKEGLTALEYLQGVGEQSGIIFGDFTQELVGRKDGRTAHRWDTEGRTWGGIRTKWGHSGWADKYITSHIARGKA